MVPSSRRQFRAVVKRNTPLCREHYKLVVGVAEFPRTRPGQFIQLACRDVDLDDAEPHEFEWTPGQRITFERSELTTPAAMLRRPFSLGGRRDLAGGEVELDVIHRVVGVATNWLSQLSAGDMVSIIGPLGNCFVLPSADQMAVLVGGGVGIPPMLYLAEALSGRRAIALAGALTRDLLPLTITQPPETDGRPSECVAEFARHGIPSIITTDDGSLGFEGYVTQALERWLERFQKSEVRSQKSEGFGPLIYTCGPELMMKRVAQIALARGIECQVAAERAMACGMGTCQSCCIKVRKPDPDKPPLPGSDWCYRLTCTDGPVFQADQLLW